MHGWEEREMNNALNGSHDPLEAHTEDAAALLEVWRAGRARVVAALEKKREACVAALKAVEAELAEVNGVLPSAAPPRVVPVRTHWVRGEVTARQLNFLREHPGSTLREIAEGTSVDKNSTAVRFAKLREKGRVHSVPAHGVLRWSVTGA